MLGTLTQAAAARRILDEVDNRTAALVGVLTDWSAINSGSRNLDGLLRMEKAIVAHAASLGAEVSYVDLPDTEMVESDGRVATVRNGRAIRLVKRPTANRRVLLTGHTDTVFPETSAFQKAEFLSETHLNGPGVADMKGGILVMLSALEAFEQSPYASQLGWEVLLSPDEETGSLASAGLLAERARAAHIGLTYEPALADGTLAGERKGNGNYTLVVEGRAAHAGRDFDKGRNAVVALASLIGEFAGLTGGRPGITVNPAVITGGTATNVVPDHAQCRINVRLARPEDAEWLEDRFDEILAVWNAREGYHVHLHGGINRPPKILTPANLALMELIKDCGADLGFEVRYVPTGGCCEGNNLAAAGLPNVDTLGVRGGNIHSADEYMLTDSLPERIRLSALILMAIADGRLDGYIERGTGS
ncbi:hydrolase [Pseudokordiimonas caeni]|uniref:hydrolase n=1 Tax=Pseudokordiimonas caeni TaxID=2997908 RepID=UPI002811889B|nr:hydrolase [Pseudokordiimonas caeni]